VETIKCAASVFDFRPQKEVSFFDNLSSWLKNSNLQV
jgi:hypothetical protein